MEKNKIKILFKSGNSVLLEVDKFTASRNVMGELIKLSWENPKPNIMYISLADIEAIFEEE